MADSYPFTLSNNRLPAVFDKIRSAARPSKFTHEFIKKIGFSSSNDRAVIPLLRRLGFIGEDGAPAAAYDRLRDSNDMPQVLGEKIKELYEELFAINTNIHKASDVEIRDAIARVTGKDAPTVARYFNTFKALTNLAKFDQPLSSKPSADKKVEEAGPPPPLPAVAKPPAKQHGAEFFYNIQIHLPATTDISVYNAIFKSLREHLIQ